MSLAPHDAYETSGKVDIYSIVSTDTKNQNIAQEPPNNTKLGGGYEDRKPSTNKGANSRIKVPAYLTPYTSVNGAPIPASDQRLVLDPAQLQADC